MKLDRTDKEVAREVFEHLLPDEKIRRDCAVFLARSIRTANQLGADRWGITLYRNDVLMNCGQIEVLQILPDLIHIIADDENLPKLPSADGVEIYRGDGKGFYVSVSSSVAVNFPMEQVAIILPKLKESHASLLHKAARHKLILGRKKAHSPGVVEFLEDYVNQRLPQPAYFNPQQEEKYRNYLSQWDGVIEFHDRTDIAAHDLFQKWRRENWDNGYFINYKSNSRLILHRVLCQHPGDGEWSSADTGNSLTRFRKACSTNVRDLRQWAEQTSNVNLEFCKDCKPETGEAEIDLVESYSDELSEPLPDVEQGLISVVEGRKKFVAHLRRERKPKIVNAKKKKVLKETGRLKCEVCSFDFREKYGKLGEEFSEVHHKIPLLTVEAEVETTLDDLAILCSNCHRMIHKTEPMESITQFRERLR